MCVPVPKFSAYQVGSKLSHSQIRRRLPWLLALWLAPISSVAVDAPLGPIIYEIANEARFEVVWFYPALNRRVVGNITRTIPLRYAIPRATDDRAIVSSYLPGAGPVALWRVSAQINPGDLFPDDPGDELTRLDLLIGSSHSDLASEKLSFKIGRDSSGSVEAQVDVYPAAVLADADSVFVGLRWPLGSPTHPQVGLQDGLGSILLQEIGYENSSGMNWGIALDNYSLEVEILDWRPGDVRQILSSVGITGFEIWYAADSSSGSAAAFSSAMLFSDSLNWQSELVQDGYVSLVAIDALGKLSEKSSLRLKISDFGHLFFSSPLLEFGWQVVESRTQTLKIQNLASTPVELKLYSEDHRLIVDPARITLDGLAEEFVRLTLQKAPESGMPEQFAIYIHNDQGWAPVKVEGVAFPDIQTSVGEIGEALPRSFSLSEVYPNPSRGASKISLTSPVSQSFTIEVFNALGQRLQTHEVHVLGQREIPLEIASSPGAPIAAGIYFLRVTTGPESLMRKFVLIK